MARLLLVAAVTGALAVAGCSSTRDEAASPPASVEEAHEGPDYTDDTWDPCALAEPDRVAEVLGAAVDHADTDGPSNAEYACRWTTAEPLTAWVRMLSFDGTDLYGSFDGLGTELQTVGDQGRWFTDDGGGAALIVVFTVGDATYSIEYYAESATSVVDDATRSAMIRLAGQVAEAAAG